MIEGTHPCPRMYAVCFKIIIISRTFPLPIDSFRFHSIQLMACMMEFIFKGLAHYFNWLVFILPGSQVMSMINLFGYSIATPIQFMEYLWVCPTAVLQISIMGSSTYSFNNRSLPSKNTLELELCQMTLGL